MSIKKILLSILVVVILGVVGYELYDYLPHILVKSSYRYMEFFPVPPYSFAQQEIIDEGTFTLPFLPPETAFSLDTNTFQLKREIEEMEDGKKYKGIDLEDLTVVELRFKNIEFLSLRIGLYSPTRGTVIESSSLAIGPNPNMFRKKGDHITIFLINENRVSIEHFSKLSQLNPSAYVIILPKLDVFSDAFFSNTYTKYLIVPTGSPSQDNIEVDTFVYNLTEKLSSLHEESSSQ